MEEVRSDFGQRFRRNPPPKQTLLRWEHILSSTLDVKDKTRSGRPSVRGEACSLVERSQWRDRPRSRRVNDLRDWAYPGRPRGST
ncbi:hypothetical protein PR048_022991 [Dryococelus australis]|uniref:Uncharacterized protein n=1 Tax=Dryococelus australis TaxID=614101 RepID=A0ABQ9GSW2_9NEOP|nr:hypothetical protein PR048_022991 [Dryococelus australis]